VDIIDAHHHLWRLAATPWLAGPAVPRIFGPYEPLRRDYTVEEYAAAVRPLGVKQSVYVQVNVEPGAEVEEVEWVQSVADAHGYPHAIVGYADLASPAVAQTLDRQMACRNLRGIRQQLHWHESPAYRFAARKDLMDDPAWRQGLAEVGKRGLVFELQVFPRQMGDAIRLVRDCPQVTFVLLHAGMLEDRSPEGWALWRMGMRTLSACPNVCVKLSGLGTFERTCSAAMWRTVIEDTVGAFGADRCLFGSNFPIESLWTTYEKIVTVMQECTSSFSPAERRAIFHDTAKRVYRLN